MAGAGRCKSWSTISNTRLLTTKPAGALEPDLRKAADIVEVFAACLTIIGWQIDFHGNTFQTLVWLLARCWKRRSPARELSFSEEVRKVRSWPWRSMVGHKTAIFRKINQNNPTIYHDALEFPDGQIVLLTLLEEGQQATVLQLPVTHECAKVPEPEKAKVG